MIGQEKARENIVDAFLMPSPAIRIFENRKLQL